MKQLSLVAIILLGTSSAAFADQGKWKNQTEKSALTDRTSVYWVIEAENKVADSIGNPRAPVFYTMCLENETRAVFAVNSYMGNDGIDMAYRIDDGQVQRTRVDVSTDGRLFGFWNGTGVKFLKDLRDKKKLVISATPYNEGPSEGVFMIEGVNDMLADVGKTCGWP